MAKDTVTGLRRRGIGRGHGNGDDEGSVEDRRMTRHQSSRANGDGSRKFKRLCCKISIAKNNATTLQTRFILRVSSLNLIVAHCSISML